MLHACRAQKHPSSYYSWNLDLHKCNYRKLCLWIFSCVCLCSGARGWLWPSALRCRHAVPSFSFSCWPTLPWQPLWMPACSQWVSNQSKGVMFITFTADSITSLFGSFILATSHLVSQPARMKTRMMSSALRCTRTWTWRASRCGWSGARPAISTDLHAAPTAASVITVWRWAEEKLDDWEGKKPKNTKTNAVGNWNGGIVW